jgi:hypothetical protein
MGFAKIVNVSVRKQRNDCFPLISAMNRFKFVTCNGLVTADPG